MEISRTGHFVYSLNRNYVYVYTIKATSTGNENPPLYIIIHKETKKKLN